MRNSSQEEKGCKDVITGEIGIEHCKKIVLGYEPNHRPWMAFIQIKKSEYDPLLGRCAGSIINREWILSAAHCFCDMTPCKQKSKFDYKAWVPIHFLFLMTIPNSSFKMVKVQSVLHLNRRPIFTSFLV